MGDVELQLVGHVCVDIAPGIEAPVSLTPGVLSEIGAPRISVGGAVGNGARAAAALGRATAVACRIGDDALGDICASVLEETTPGGVVLSRSGTAATSYSVIVQPPDRDRSIWHHTGANDEFDGTCELVGARVVHFGYPTLCPAMTADGGAPSVALFERARAQGSATSLDLSYCAENSPLRGYDWDGYFSAVLPHVDLFCPSWDDVVSARGNLLEPEPGLVESTADDFLARGAAVVLITLGERGSYLATAHDARARGFAEAIGADPASWANRRAWVPAAPLERFVSSNGAGDTFKVAFLAGALDGRDPVAAATWAAEVVGRGIQGDPLLGSAP